MPVRRSKPRNSPKVSHKQSKRISPSSVRGEKRKKLTSPRYSHLTAREKAEYSRAIELLSDLRLRKDPYSKLLRRHHLTTSQARKHLGDNLIGGGRGKRVRASKTDMLERWMRFPRSYGDPFEVVRGSLAASQLSRFFLDRAELLNADMRIEKFEARWRGVRIDGREVFADAKEIFRMADAGILDFGDLYSSGGPEK
jgi:hypothetical protein